MSMTVMGRLFAVPLLIISIIVGCAVVVVLMFGSITSDRERPIGELLDVLETSTGEKVAGVLLPQEKELWQVSRELALRLSKKDSELQPEELGEVVSRLTRQLTRDAGQTSELSEMGRKRLHFVMHALAQTDAPEAIEPLAAMLHDPYPETRREALLALSRLGRIPAAKGAMVAALEDRDPVVRVVACAALSSVGGGNDVLDALSRAYVDEDREVCWNAALALARLGSTRGKPLLMEMLSRSYWEGEVPVRVTTERGEVNEYPLSSGRVAEYLAAAIDAGSRVEDEEVWRGIRGLSGDASPTVREAVRRALESRESRRVGVGGSF